MRKRSLRVLSSVKLTLALIILIAAASIIGTLIPQGRGGEFYAAKYGGLSPLLVRLQLTDLYHSVWYLGLLALFALNTAVCTLTRLPPKWKRVFNPRITSDEDSLRAFDPKARWGSSAVPGDTEISVEEALRRRGYRIRSYRDGDRLHLLARKRVAGRFGPDIVHSGLLVILAGGILSGLGGFRTEVALSEGETAPIPRAAFSLRLEEFTTEFHADGSVKDWKSTLTILEGGDAAATKTVEVNHPLTHRGFSFYQMSYGYDWGEARLEILVTNAVDPSFRRTVWLRPGERRPLDDGHNTEIGLLRFFPDFILDENNEPRNRSFQPNNPAGLVEGRRNGKRIFERWIFARYPDFGRSHGADEAGYALEFRGLDAPQYSVLEAARDPGVPLIWIGSLLLVAGLGLAFYWPSWEIRVIIATTRAQTAVSAGGTALRSRDRFAAEFNNFVAEVRRFT